jgi:glycosyltransferase involved in cell wall biosynthesis
MLRALGSEWDVHVIAPVAAAEAASAELCERELGVTLHALPALDPLTSPRRKLGHWLRGRSDVVWRRWPRDTIRAARAIVGRVAPDLIVVDGTFAEPLVPPGFAGRVVSHLHNVEAEVLTHLGATPGLRHLPGRIEARLVRWLERRAAARSNLTITVSERDRDAVREAVPTALVRVIENSVDLGTLAPLATHPAGDPVLLFVGSFDYPPNREAAFSILDHHAPALRCAWPGLRIRLVGSDPTGDIAVRAAGTAGVEYAGFIGDLREEYAAATAVLVPLSSGGGTRIKVLEAFALGRPVIASEVAVAGLAVGVGVHYLSCDTPDLAVTSLRRILEAGDGRVRDDLVRAGRELVERRYSHAVIEAEFVAAIRGLSLSS